MDSLSGQENEPARDWRRLLRAQDPTEGRFSSPAVGAPTQRVPSLLRNTGWSMLALVAPLMAAVVAIPLLISGLGADRFGVLTLAWALVGYFNLFDLGFGRALTQQVAAALGTPAQTTIARLFWTFVWATLAFGTLGGLILAAASPWVVRGMLGVGPELQHEAQLALLVLALGLPFSVVTPGLRGLLEAHMRFDLAAAVRTPTNVALVAAPVAVLLFTRSLVAVMASLVVARALGSLLHFWVCRRVSDDVRRPSGPDRVSARALASTGGWMTVSNVAAPLMAYGDRFVVGALVSVAAAAYYSTPFDLITKVALVPLAFASVLFPAFATSHRIDAGATIGMMVRTTQALLLFMMPIILVIMAFAPELMRLWLEDAFARAGTPVLKILAVGVLLNALAHIPLSYLQGIGRSDLVARVHLIELPIYMLALLLLVRGGGIEGAALAWSLRSGADALIVLALSARASTMAPRQAFPSAVGILAAVAAAASMATIPGTLALRAVILVCMLTTLGAISLRWFSRAPFTKTSAAST